MTSTQSLLDQGAPQRESETLDKTVLETCLRDAGVISGPVRTIEQFPGGASNLTYRIVTDGEDLILRRPPFGHKAKSAHDMKREYRVLKALAPHLGFCPKPVYLSSDDNVLGSEFYLMERIEGVIIRKDMPAELAGQPALNEAMCETFLETLARLHGVDPEGVGLASFGKPQGYVHRQIEGWISRMEAAVTKETVPFDDIANWLREAQPSDNSGGAIIHNDFKFDNVIWSEESLRSGKPQIIGVLDWEMSTLGDPLMDLGSVLAYWVESGDHPAMLHIRMMPTHLPGMLTRQQLSKRYFELLNKSAVDVGFYHTFGLFRLAVIVQQIYFRYAKGQSDNPKFAEMGQLANLLISEANRARC